MKLIFACCLIPLILSFTMDSSADEIKLMIPNYKPEKSNQGAVAYWSLQMKDGKKAEAKEYSEEDLKQFVQKFKGQGYGVDQIELWVEGKAESGGVTRLFVSVEGGGGIKIILRPKN